MTAVNEARTMAHRASGSRWLERLTRIGFLGYGVTHLVVGWIALQLAFGKAPAEGDQNGAFKTLAATSIGKALLVVVVVGMVAMAIWQLLEAAIGHTDEHGKRRVFERVASAFKACLYAYLAFTAAKIVAGAAKSSPDQQQQATSTILSSSGGRLLVGLIGMVVAAIGAGLVWYGLKKEFERHLKTAAMSASTRRATRALGMVGYAAKGVAYGTLGLLILTAAVTFDPAKSRGLDEALRTLASQSFGVVILIVVALGIAAYGVFCFFQARYRKV